MSRLLLVGDGPSDTRWDARTGFLLTLLEQLAADSDAVLQNALDCDGWEPVSLPELPYSTHAELAAVVRLKPPQPKGMAKVAARAMRAAQILQCDALIVLVDNDHEAQRHADLARGLVGCHVPYAFGVATQMLEAWVIADQDVLAPVVITILRQPEDIWGDKRDPNGQHPKAVLSRALNEARVKHVDVLANWSATRAVVRAPRLREFCKMIVDRLLRDRRLFHPIAWDE